MRRLLAIMLLSILLFYHAGYYGLYINALYQLESSWNFKIESGDLPENLLQTKTIAVTFPYQPDQQEFQPVSEKLEIEGKFYRIVKQKYAKDTLHIVYVNDLEREQIQSSFNEWIQSMTQKSVSKDGKQIVLTILTKNYLSIYFYFNFDTILSADLIHFTSYHSSFQLPILNIPTPPPKVECYSA
ncbi:hypothetical protein BH23BAC1_BH23BAC1_49710 [soil metagenome]